jgi:hypothetical protein
MRKLIIAVCTCVAASFFSQAQKPVEVSVKLRDGNNVSGTTALGDITLTTDYGKLVIPVKNVSSIKIGLPNDKAVYDKAIGLAKQLSGTNEDLKKGAYEELIKLGIKAIPAISDFIADPKNVSEYTGEFTPDNALSELKTSYNIDDFTDGKDIVTVDNQYVMGGQFEFQKLDIKTEYGNLSIPKEKIKTVDIMYASGDGGEMNFKLIGSKHISGNQNGGWLKTGITLKMGQKFSVFATGEVTLASLSNQKYKPDGSYVTATGETYKGTSDGGEGDYVAPANTTTYPTYGQVVWKIGEASTLVNKAGAKFNGTANAAGMLYISIYETVYNAANSGSYNVKIGLK